MKKYRPLPDELYIGISKIEGNGMFTTEFLDEGKELGITHIKNDSGDFHCDFIRTPLGGFINHSEMPNCVLYKSENYLMMKTIKPIKASEELTVTYDLYDPCKNYI